MVKTGKYFEYFQPNRKDIKDKYGDCVIRAMCKALNKGWLEVFEDLLPYARERQCMPNATLCIDAYVEEHGGHWASIKVEKGHKRPTVESFAKDHPQGVYILRVAHHVVTVVDGKYFDTWDSGCKSLYGYWVL